MRFINKNTGESISQETWLQLSELGKSNFIQQVELKTSHTTNNYNTTANVNNKTSDILGLGEVAAVAVAVPLVVVGSIFGLFD